jgi:hypothetical protein
MIDALIGALEKNIFSDEVVVMDINHTPRSNDIDVTFLSDGQEDTYRISVEFIE